MDGIQNTSLKSTYQALSEGVTSTLPHTDNQGPTFNFEYAGSDAPAVGFRFHAPPKPRSNLSALRGSNWWDDADEVPKVAFVRRFEVAEDEDEADEEDEEVEDGTWEEAAEEEEDEEEDEDEEEYVAFARSLLLAFRFFLAGRGTTTLPFGIPRASASSYEVVSSNDSMSSIKSSSSALSRASPVTSTTEAFLRLLCFFLACLRFCTGFRVIGLVSSISSSSSELSSITFLRRFPWIISMARW